MEGAEPLKSQDSALVLGRMVLARPWKVLLAAILGIAVGLAGWAMAYLIQSVLDHASDPGIVATIALGASVAVAARAVLTVVRRIYHLAFTRSMEWSLAKEYLDRLGDAEYAALRRFDKGDLYQRLRALEHVRNAVEDRMLGLVFDTLLVLVAGVIVFRISPILSAFAMAGALVPAIIVRFLRKSIQSSFEETQRGDAALMQGTLDSLNGLRDLRVLGATREAVARIGEQYGLFQGQRIRHLGKLSVIGSLTGLLSTLTGVLILYFGARQVAGMEITAGQLMFAFTMSGLMLGPIENLVVSWIFFESAAVALRRYREIVTLPVEASGKAGPPVEMSVKLDSVSFSYIPGVPVLSDVSLEIPAGSSLAIVGESGAGKSTLLYLLSGLYPAERGAIRIGNVDLSDLDPAWWRSRIGAVFQEPHLFDATIEENLRLGAPGVSAEKVQQALRQARAEFVSDLAMGLRTHVTEARFSAGQVQRLALARALVREPKILLLDEATSNLDADTEAAIWETLKRRPADCTLIFVTHRLKSSIHADRIVVLDEGRVVESGRYDELMAGQGVYRRFWNRQSSTAG